MVLPISDESLALAKELLMREEVVAFPTETVYGLGANAVSTAAVERIYALKGRPRHNPLIVHVADLQSAMQWSSDWPALATTLAKRFWPGPLTLVVPRSPRISPLVSAGLQTVALRVPAHPVALRLLQKTGLPLAAPSANRSMAVSPTTAEHVRRGLPGVPLILDGGPCAVGIESAVVDLTATPPRLLRPGLLDLRSLREVIPSIELAAELDSEGTEARIAPGMLARHYAPRAQLRLLPAEPALALAILRELPPPRGLLSQKGLAETAQLAAQCLAVETLPTDAPGYAAGLYAALHRLDEQGVASIGVVSLVDGDFANGWHAIRDRLRRASKEAST